jgi:hypothetical protein
MTLDYMNHRDYVLGMTPMALALDHHCHPENTHFHLSVLIELGTVFLLVVWLQRMPPRSHINPQDSSLLNHVTTILKPLSHSHWYLCTHDPFRLCLIAVML